jgi:hypothetical protein
MAGHADNAVLYTAVYDDVEAAKADPSAFEQLHKAEMVGKYDAAVIDKEDGKPHVEKRVDRPTIRVIPEWLGSGALPRRDLHDAADALGAGRADRGRRADAPAGIREGDHQGQQDGQARSERGGG